MGFVRILLAGLIAAIIAGCGGGTGQPAHTGEASAIIHTDAVAESDPAFPPDAASMDRITYVSRSGVDDSNPHVTGVVYQPKFKAPQGGVHVVAYAPDVLGVTAECARSPQSQARDSAAIGALLRAGYVVTVPDYQGLGHPSDGQRLYHPYLDSTTAGYNLMDAVRAAKNLVADTSPIWAAVGEGVGGQAAWALNELADNYGLQSLRGTVSLSPVADVSGLADAAAGGTLTPAQQQAYIRYLAALAAEYKTDFTLDDYRRGVVKENWDLLLGCQPGDDDARAAVRARITPDDLRPANPQALATLRAYLKKTTLPQGPAQQPMLVAFGGDDPLIPSAWTERAISGACALRDRITIRRQPAPAADGAVLDWIARRLAEQPVPDDCPSMPAARPAPSSRIAAPPATMPAPAVPDSPGPGPSGEPTGVSLIDGWLPLTIQALAGLAVLAGAVAVGRSGRRGVRGISMALGVGVLFAMAVRWWFDHQGWGSVYPWGLWLWTAVTGSAATLLLLGWSASPWWRRVVALLAVPLCVLSAGVALNVSLGYLPTVQTALQRVTGSQPPQWIDESGLAEMRRTGARPTRGTVVRITTPSTVSGFQHRGELVYLPPVWFTADPPPQLPVVMMFGAELSTPSDWLQSGRVLGILDAFAVQHRGATPVVVFPDTSGSFTNDTECVNGPRGNAADHLINEVVPYVITHFGVSPSASNWGLAGWSSGGTCSLTLAVRHPELFSAIVDLDGQLGPNAGRKQQTIARLFGGDAEAWAAFDPKTIVEARRDYPDLAAWIGVSDQVPARHRPAGSPADGDLLRDWDTYSEDHAKTADQLCALLSAHGAECSVVGYPGGHDFPSAANGFKDALPWLAGRLGTPGVRPVPLPGA